VTLWRKGVRLERGEAEGVTGRGSGRVEAWSLFPSRPRQRGSAKSRSRGAWINVARGFCDALVSAFAPLTSMLRSVLCSSLGRKDTFVSSEADAA
jgi:hypothetical protein